MRRRNFLATTAAATAAMHAVEDKPAILGGTPVRQGGPKSWPQFDQGEEQALIEVLRSGKWYRGSGLAVRKFEDAYAKLTGAKHCLAVANGTSALLTSLGALGVGPGDEVIVPPYTFVATVNAVLARHALPVFVDTNRETFQMDAGKLAAAMSPRTKAVIPVHMAGSAADLDAILPIAARHRVPVIEDAAQAHLGEWRGHRLGTYGKLGCFSFQASKNLNSGEGGAVLTNDSELFQRASAFHNNSKSSHRVDPDGYASPGLNLRLTEFQAALLVAQMSRIEEQSKHRETNAALLTSLFKEIPGIMPAKLHDGCTRSAWHLYMFRYDRAEFAGLPKEKFLKAMAAEGVPCSGGYKPLNKERMLTNTLATPAYRRMYDVRDLNEWADRSSCPENDKLCQEAVWFTQTMLLLPRADMEHIATAIRKIQKHAKALL